MEENNSNNKEGQHKIVSHYNPYGIGTHYTEDLYWHSGSEKSTKLSNGEIETRGTKAGWYIKDGYL